LILEEAGGTIESINGSQPFPVGSNLDYRKISFPILSGADSELVSKARGQIRPKSIKQ
jgi:hypothetical protein